MTALGFSDYFQEYRTQGVGSLLYALISRLVRQTVVRYPPVIYSPNQVWDEDAIAALCHDFTVEKLLKVGRLEYHLLTQETELGLSRVLARDFRHFLINQKRRSEYTNMFDRVRSILRSDPRFQNCDGAERSTSRIWGLAEWKGKAVTRMLEAIVSAMFTVHLPPLVKYRADSAKYSHLVAKEDLAHLLSETFVRLDQCVEIELIMDALRYRLNLLDVDLVSLDSSTANSEDGGHVIPTNDYPDATNIEQAVVSIQVAEDIFQRLSDRQRLILALRLSRPDPTLDNIGNWIGVSKSTVHNELRTIAEYITAAELEDDDAKVVLSNLLELCEPYLTNSGEQTVE